MNRKEIKCGRLTVIQHNDSNWGVIDDENNVIIPFGKYHWIDKFDQGLARAEGRCELQPNARDGYQNRCTSGWGVIDEEDNVIIPFCKYHWIHEPYKGLYRAQIKVPLNSNGDYHIKYGIINKLDEVVVPFEYDDLWNIRGDENFTVTVKNNGERGTISFRYVSPVVPKRNQDSLINSPFEIDISDELNDYGTNYSEYAGSYAQEFEGYSDDVIDDAFEGDPDAYWNID